MSANTFTSLGLPEELLQAISDLGFESASDIQAQAIPPALEGHDLIGLSQTGSGKTAAFALPALTKIDVDRAQAQCLILCPTRELAVQVCEEVHRLGKHMKGLQAIPVYGGTPIDRQIRQLKKGAHIIVGTPGRLLDHLRRRSFNPNTISLAVLDEADRMLDMGFREEMEDLLAQLAEDRQTLFFSATMNKGVERLINRFGNEPVTIQIERKSLTVDTIKQEYYEVRNRSKVEVLSRILDIENPKLAIIFGNTKRIVDDITEHLQNRGYTADRLHGDIAQASRERTLKRFRNGELDVLVATDVAARGIDVDNVDIVFNYDLPQDHEDYVHRIGRTGRAGNNGHAISFIYGRDIYRLQQIERYIKQKIPRAAIPSLEQVEGRAADQLFNTLREKLNEGQTTEQNEKKPDYSEQLDRLLGQGHSATDIANALLDLLHQTNSGRTPETIPEDHPDFLTESEKKKQGIRKERKPRERRDRDDRPKRDEAGRRTYASDENMKTLFLNIGKKHSISPGDIVGMMYNEGGVPDGSLGKIQLMPGHTLIDVPADHADKVIENSKRAKIKGRPFVLDHDQGPGPGLGKRPDPKTPRKKRDNSSDRKAIPEDDITAPIRKSRRGNALPDKANFKEEEHAPKFKKAKKKEGGKEEMSDKKQKRKTPSFLKKKPKKRD